MTLSPVTLVIPVWLAMTPAGARAQIDQVRAAKYFEEAAELCEREGGRLWGVSLCGPMVFADPATGSIATNQPAPAADRPAALGFANAPVDWGGKRWSAYVWSMIPADDAQARGRLMLHELFHRVQGDLGLMTMGKPSDHLDTLDGRYWLQLEWRALARALGASGGERSEALGDALAFRATRRSLFADAAESERVDEIREGLAQYTGTVLSASFGAEAATADAIRQLTAAEKDATYVRTFAYPSGTAYGVLLDTWSPGWTRRVKGTDDLGRLVMEAARVQPAEDAERAARRYGGVELRVAEEKRGSERNARVAELRRRFVDGPVLRVPRGKSAVVNNTGATPIPGEGTVFFEYRTTAEWGSLHSTSILVSSDGATLRLAAPFRTDADTLVGDGWKLTLARGFVVRPGERAGDYQLVRDGG